MLAADPVHDLERAVLDPPAGGARHERDEVLGLVGARADVQRLEREARVPDPRVAVVPVALAADVLGQRRGGRGDDRARGPVRQALQHPRAEPHEVAVRALVDVVLGLPRAPGLGRVGDPRRRPVGRRRLASATPRPAPSAARSRALALGERECRAHRRVRDRRPGRDARDGDLTGPAERAAAVVGPPEQRAHEPVLGPRGQLHRSSTSPDTHSTRRSSSCGASMPRSCPRWPSANASASVRRTDAGVVVNVVSTMSVPGQIAALGS